MRRPLAGILIVYTLGIILGKMQIISLLIALCLISLGFIVFYSNKAGITFLLTSFLILGYGTTYMAIHNSSQLEAFHNQEMIMNGHILQPIVEKEGRKDIYLEIKNIEIDGKSYSLKEKERLLGTIYLNEHRPDISLSPGDIIHLKGRVKIPKGIRNPGGFDYALYLRTKDVYATITINSQSIEKVGYESLGLLKKIIYKTKENIQKIIDENLSKDHGALLKGILFGDKELEPHIRDSFAIAGIAHVLAVSGLHVGFLIALVLYLCKKFKLPNWITFISFTLTLLFYILITGATPSVIRASAMGWISLLASMGYKKYDGLSALSLSGMIILLPNPLLVFTPSFQLSFLAVLSIILFYPVLLGYLQKIKFMPDSMAKLLGVTMAAQIGTLPSSLYHFYQISIVSVITNLLIIPIIGILLVICIIAILTYSFIPLISSYLFFIASFFFTWIIEVARIFSTIPFASVYRASFTWLEITLYILFFLIVGSYIPLQTKKSKVGLFLILFILLIYEIINYLLPNPLIVTFLDVNQGDSILIQTPQNRNIFIDGGGYAEYGNSSRKISEDVLIPVFYAKGLQKIDLAIITHPHNDHMKGIEELIGRVPIVALGIYDMENEDLHRIISRGVGNDVEIISLKEEDRLHIEKDLEMEILWPSSGYLDKNINNTSLVSRLEYKDVSFLFTGDIEKEVEEELLGLGKNIQANILKVPHHGSDTSSSEGFIRRVNPRIGVIPVGENNTFGHPNMDTLNTLKSIISNIYRTDERGAVEISTNGSWVKIKTYIDEN